MYLSCKDSNETHKYDKRLNISSFLFLFHLCLFRLGNFKTAAFSFFVYFRVVDNIIYFRTE